MGDTEEENIFNQLIHNDPDNDLTEEERQLDIDVDEGFSPDSPRFDPTVETPPRDFSNEEIDPDFIISSTEDAHINMDSINMLVNEGDLFIIIFEEDEEFNDHLAIVKDIQGDQISFVNEYQTDLPKIQYTDGNIILQADDYHIIDIEKVEEFDMDNISDTEFLIEEINEELDITETTVKEYTIQEKKEDMITELISALQGQGNDILIHEISSMMDDIVTIMGNDVYDTSSSALQFIKHILHKKSYILPRWIIPIITNKKVLYKEEEEDNEELEDTIHKDYITTLEQTYNIANTFNEYNPNSYSTIIKKLNAFQPYENDNSEQKIIPYEGLYIRSCNPCNTLSTQIPYDMVNTRKEHLLPIKQSNVTVLSTILPKENLALAGFYTLPHTFQDFTIKCGSINLYEYYLLSNVKYSYKPFSKRFENDKIIPHMMNTDTTNMDPLWELNIHSYLFYPEVTQEQIGDVLETNFPNLKNIIQVIPKDIFDSILNYQDFEKVFLHYDINIHSISPDERIMIHEKIKDNIQSFIRNYNKTYKRKVIKNVVKKKISLSLSDKIKLAKNYISTILDIPLKNYYLHKIITKFSRNAHINEDKNYLYENIDDGSQKLMCNHNLYSCISHHNKEAFDTLMSNFGDVPVGGNIYCKICGHYLCPESFSTLEGFSDDKPSNTREVLNTDQDTINEYNEEQLAIQKNIIIICNLIGCKLTKYDEKQIINHYESINQEELINHRYNTPSVFKKLPMYSGIIKQYKMVIPAKTPQEKQQNKKNKVLRDKALSTLKEYLVACNQLFSNIFLILFYLQTSIPPYLLKSKQNIYLWDTLTQNETWDTVKHQPHQKISVDTIDTILMIIQKIIKEQPANPFWKHISQFLKESNDYKGFPNFKEQFMFSSSYILRNDSLKKKLKLYFDFNQDEGSAIYYKEHWPTFKPKRDTVLITSINKNVTDQLKEEPFKKLLLKKYSTLQYENISHITPLREAYETPKYQTFSIPYSDIMKNEAYQRLFDYSVHLHGTSTEIPIINLLIHRFLDTIPDPGPVKTILSNGIGWKDGITNINYQDFKTTFVKDITEHFKRKQNSDKDTINIYIHIHLNNWNGMLLNGHPKRNYNNYTPNVFPREPFEDIDKDHITNLFKQYCTNDDDEIVETFNNDYFITNLIADPNIQRDIVCDSSLSKTKENFEKIIKYTLQKNEIPTRQSSNEHISYDSRIYSFIEENNLLENNTTDTFQLFQDIYYLRNLEDPIPQSLLVLNNMILLNDKYKNIIQSYFIDAKESEIISQDQYRRYTSLSGRSLETVSILLDKYLDECPYIGNHTDTISSIVARLSQFNDLPGTLLHDNIPKQWKISDTNIEHMKTFINQNEFLLHGDTFNLSTKEKYSGFNNYRGQYNLSLCFQGLHEYIKKFNYKNIDILVGESSSNPTSFFTEDFCLELKKILFLHLFIQIIDYCNALRDEISVVSNNANLLYQSLEIQDQLTIQSSIGICTRFCFDLFIHFFEDYTDPMWIHQISVNLTNELSKQKEREKQNLINDLESKSNDERYVTTQLQTYGIVNWFGNAGKDNLERKKGDDYQSQLLNDRIETVKELFYSNEDAIQQQELNGVDTVHLNLGENDDTNETLDGGYDYHEEGSDIEGDDDNDDEGNYRED
jgi:hypothetical protein